MSRAHFEQVGSMPRDCQISSLESGEKSTSITIRIQTILDTWSLFDGFDASFDLIFNDSLNFQKTHHIRAAFKSSY